MNYLEQLLSEWLEYRGYFIRRNVKVGPLAKGGYECELDIVGFNPKEKHLIHFEPSMDADSWEKREKRYKKKFDAGKKYIPELFKGFKIPKEIDQRAVFILTGKTREIVGGGKIYHVKEILKEIYENLKEKNVLRSIVPEQFPVLRTFQMVIEYKNYIFK